MSRDGGPAPAGRTLPVADGASLRRWAGQLVRQRRRSLAAVLGLLIIVTAAFSAVPAIIGAAVDVAATGGERSDLAWLVAAMVAVIVVTVAGVILGRYEAARFGESILDELRTRVYDATVTLPGSMVEAVGTGELVARATGDVATLSNATRNSIPAVLFSTIFVIGVTAALFIADWRLAIASILVGVAVATWGVRWYLRNAGVRYRRERQADADRSAALLEHYTGRRTMWAFGADRLSRDVLRNRAQDRLITRFATTAARNRLRPSLRLGQGAALATTLGYGAFLFNEGSLTAGALTATSLYLLQLGDPLNTMLEQLDELQQAKAAFERIVGLIEWSDEHRAVGVWPDQDRDATQNGNRVGLDVELVDVVFGYEPGRPILEIDHLRITAGERVLIVGPSGAGKSTLAGLVCGTHDPWRGDVLVGGHPIAGLSRDELRQRVAVVTQETHVFARSIRDNVTLGRPNADDGRILAALEATDAWSWVAELEDGLETIVSTTHPAMTPARAQQLNLARILCLDPPVVVLDEAMADLDPASAGRTEQRLRRALAGRTVLSIAHRLDAAPAMDRILMVSDGRVVADGDHTTLLADGPFARLWSAWQEVHRPSPEPD